jgi:hypothetical protein
MSSLIELRDALYATLDSKGALDQIRGKLQHPKQSNCRYQYSVSSHTHTLSLLLIYNCILTFISFHFVFYCSARIRSEILLSLDDSSESKNPSHPSNASSSAASSSSIPPAVSQTNVLINELIRDYLEFNGYRNTLSVFLPETGIKSNSPSLTREFLSQELHLTHNSYSKQIPLLYSILALLQQGNLGQLMKESVQKEERIEMRKEQDMERKMEKMGLGSQEWKFNGNPLMSTGHRNAPQSQSQSQTGRAASNMNAQPLPSSISSSLPQAQFPGLTPSSSANAQKPGPIAYSTAPSSASSVNGLSSNSTKSALRPSSASSSLPAASGSKSVSFHSPVAAVETVERLSYSNDEDDDDGRIHSYQHDEESYEEDDDFYHEER